MTYCRVEQELNAYLDEQDALEARSGDDEAELEQWLIETMDSDDEANRELCGLALSESEEFDYLVNTITRIDADSEYADSSYAKAARAIAKHIKERLTEYK